MNTFKIGTGLLAVLISLSLRAQLSLDHVILVGGGFGIDGATNQPYPAENSVQNAAEIFEKIQSDAVQTEGDKKIISPLEFTKDGVELQLLVPKSYAEIFFGDSNADVALKFNITESVSFSGPVAKELFEALQVKGVELVGATSKTVANLSCEKLVTSPARYNCSFKDFAALASRGKTLGESIESIPGGVQALLDRFGL